MPPRSSHSCSSCQRSPATCSVSSPPSGRLSSTPPRRSPASCLRRSPSAQALSPCSPATSPQPALASEEMDGAPHQLPPACDAPRRGWPRLGRRFSANVAVGSSPEDNDTTTLWEGLRGGFDRQPDTWRTPGLHHALSHWLGSGLRVSQTGVTWAQALSPASGVLPSKLVFDVHERRLCEQRNLEGAQRTASVVSA